MPFGHKEYKSVDGRVALHTVPNLQGACKVNRLLVALQ